MCLHHEFLIGNNYLDLFNYLFCFLLLVHNFITSYLIYLVSSKNTLVENEYLIYYFILVQYIY